MKIINSYEVCHRYTDKNTHELELTNEEEIKETDIAIEDKKIQFSIICFLITAFHA